MKRALILCCFFGLASLRQLSPQAEVSRLSGPYLGQKPPRISPQLFAPPVFAESVHSAPAFAGNGLEVYYVPWSTLKMKSMKQVNNYWTKPQTVPFASDYDAENPWLTADGRRLYFTSTRPLGKGETETKEKYWGENIWYVDRLGDGWSDPIPLGSRVNSLDLHWQFSLDDLHQDLYFSASSSERGGGSDIYRSAYIDGDYATPEKLGGAVNTNGDEDTPFIGPDGQYLIFARKPGADTYADLYISFRSGDGSWQDAVNLGGGINSPAHEVCPVVTKDGKYLFFISLRSGRPRIYWADASFINKTMKPGECRLSPNEGLAHEENSFRLLGRPGARGAVLTPGHFRAIRKGNIPAVTALTEEASQAPTDRDGEGMTPLYYSDMVAHAECIGYLIEQGAKLELQ